MDGPGSAPDRVQWTRQRGAASSRLTRGSSFHLRTRSRPSRASCERRAAAEQQRAILLHISGDGAARGLLSIEVVADSVGRFGRCLRGMYKEVRYCSGFEMMDVFVVWVKFLEDLL